MTAFGLNQAAGGSAALTAEPIIYRLDAEDRVKAVSEKAWTAFATANQAATLTPEAVCGHALWDFVAGEEVRHLYRRLFVRVRGLATTVRVPARCDSARERRFMELEISPLPGRDLLITSWMLRTETADADRFIYVLREPPERFLHMCSWCQRVEVGVSWLELEDAIARVRAFEPPVPVVSHRICPDCHERARSAD